MTPAYLPHHHHSLRQCPAPSGPRARVRAGRCAGPALPSARSPGPIPDRHRRQLAEERAGRQAGRRPRPGVRRPQRRGVCRARRAAVTRVDDVIRTSRDPRHRTGVERLWLACADAGDLYRKHYEGLYCVGCEAFYTPAELTGGRCPEHGVEPQRVAEENWFFRLSRYTDRLHDLVAGGRLRIEPAERRNEVLGFIAGGLEDLSVSRSTARARGWGIPVPGDPGQVVYVWWDALGNYITALDYGTGGENHGRWWVGADRRIHLVGKGVLRFHAVYWPAMLPSAGQPPPTDVVVHDYLTAGGRKISKSGGRRRRPDRPGRARTAPTPSAGGCCETCRASATSTSRGTGSSRARTTNSPTAWATWSTGSSRWSGSTATAWCPSCRTPARLTGTSGGQ